MSGLFFEEFTVGQRFEHAVTRTVTETDNLLITTLTHNPQPLHLDAEFCKGTEFGRILVNSIFTFGLMLGVSVGDTTLGTTSPGLTISMKSASRNTATNSIRTHMFESVLTTRSDHVGWIRTSSLAPKYALSWSSVLMLSDANP